MTTEAGREMDAEIAEKIMDYEIVLSGPMKTKMILIDVGIQALLKPRQSLGLMPAMIPNYSTDIAAAWTMAEKIGGLWGVGYGPARKEYAAYFQTAIHLPTARGYADTAPLALCKAALEAKAREAK